MTSEVTEEETKKTVSGTEEEDEYDYENEENLDFSNEHNENDDYDSELENDDFDIDDDDDDELDGDDANDNDSSNFAHVDSNEIVELRFLLPDDAEFKSPWRVDLRVARRRTIAEVKSRLCFRLKVSNEDRFQLQLATGLFPDNSMPIAACVRRGAPLAERLFVVRRDVNLRVQAAVAERLSSILTPRAGGTTSSIDDDDTTTSSTALNASGALDSAAVVAGTLATSAAKAAPSSAAPAAPSGGKKKLALSAERQATAVVAPQAAAIAAITSSGDVGDAAAPGVLVEFLFPPGLLAFNNLQKKSMRSLPTSPMSVIKAALVAKCAPTAAPAEQLRLAESIELQSMTGVLFRDNDTLSENFFLDQHCVVTLVVREVVGRGFSGRKAPLAAAQRHRLRRPRQHSAPTTAPPEDAKKDKAMSPRSLPTSPKAAKASDTLASSPSRASDPHTATSAMGASGTVVRVRHRRRTAEKPDSPVGTPLAKKGTSSPNRVGAVDAPRVDVPRLNLSPRRSDNSVANNNDNFPRPQSARAVIGAFSADAATDARATVVACFFLPPSEAFHGLEKKLMAIGAFDTAGQIKRHLFEAIRCQSNADDYELRTRASKPSDASAIAMTEQPKSPRRLSGIGTVVSAASSSGTQARGALSPRRGAGPLHDIASALEHSGNTSASQRLSPGETYFDLSMGEGGAASSGAGGSSTSALVASPRRVTGRAYSGHVFADSERLADFFKMDHFEGIELELVAKGSTFKPLAVTHIPLHKGKSATNVTNDATPTSLASALSLQALSSVLPVDDILAGRKRVLNVKPDAGDRSSSAFTDNNDADALSSADTDDEAVGGTNAAAATTPARHNSSSSGNSDAPSTPSYAEAIRLAKAESKLKSPRSTVDAVVDASKLSASGKSPSSPSGPTTPLASMASKVKKKSTSSPTGRKGGEYRKSGLF
jgi:hypothetical protein